MPITEFSSYSPQAIKVWCDSVWREAIHKTDAKKFMGTGPRSIIQRLTDLEKGRGDTIYFDILHQLNDYGVVGSKY